jgi:uncharacterized membrane protein HdeD (DUF308 family)
LASGLHGEPPTTIGDHYEHRTWWTTIQSRVARQEADMTTDLIQPAYRRTWWALVLRGLLGIATGAVILWRPLQSVAALALFIAVWAIFSGIVQIVHAFDLRPVFSRWWVVLVSGLASVAFGGAAIYFYPVLSLAFAVTWTSWWLLVTGAFAISDAMAERRLGAPWGWTLAFGILGIATGALAVITPPATLVALMGVIAGFGLAGGIVHLIGAYRLASFKRDVRRVASVATAH